MFDPGALGTLMIGLESVRQEQDLNARPATRRHRKETGRSARRALAGALRSMANIVESSSRSTSSGRA